MAEFTKEQLIEKLERRLAVTTHYPDFEEAQLDAQIFKIALEALTAGMEQEPVAWLLSGGGAKNNVSFDSGNAYADPLREVTPLYASPPAPVSVPDLKPVGFLFVSDDGSVAYSPAGWPMKGFNLIGPIYGDVNACRAAMLQSDGTLTNEGTMQLSGNSEQIEPVSNRDELPLDYLQGHKDGLEWAAQLAEANHPQTGDWLYDDPIDLARAIRKGPDMPTVQAGNYPVTPDGWISCSERMPNDAQWCVVNTKYGYYVQCWSEGQGWLGDDISIPECDVINWMPLPEPPQEVNRG
ncbi:TPA: DUF551 domain-containing protein [Escherichia coli]|uniref:DUF551 domain-containing protein n=2 Tax=Escherichia coli TaxID=562 RepID=UPI00264D531E|nr:DUF551 domain-containing protein [Escherichia coli]MDN7360990.1 DUF551 domain-containing protein [Escherichia coli]HAY4433869.1 DUF551 domain-containing protein [Escherichia coli]